MLSRPPPRSAPAKPIPLKEQAPVLDVNPWVRLPFSEDDALLGASQKCASFRKGGNLGGLEQSSRRCRAALRVVTACPRVTCTKNCFNRPAVGKVRPPQPKALPRVEQSLQLPARAPVYKFQLLSSCSSVSHVWCRGGHATVATQQSYRARASSSGKAERLRHEDFLKAHPCLRRIKFSNHHSYKPLPPD